MTVSSKELRDMVLETGMEAGMQEQMDVLEELAISLRVRLGFVDGPHR